MGEAIISCTDCASSAMREHHTAGRRVVITRAQAGQLAGVAQLERLWLLAGSAARTRTAA